MMKSRKFSVYLSGGAALMGFVLGHYYNDITTNFLPVKSVHAHATPSSNFSPTTISLPELIQIKQSIKDETRVEDLEIWKQPSRAAEIMRWGYPGFDNLRTFEDFVISYDRRNRTAHWVVEHLSPDRMVYNPDVDRSKCIFKTDLSIHPYFQSQNEDYRRSGYDRGHLAAAANHRRSQLAMEQTFLLSNMSPQVGKGFNRDKWNELEKYVRKLAQKHLNVYICSGPLYLPFRDETDGCFYVKYKVIGNNRVAVPTHFFKVVLIETAMDHFELEAYLMPNASIPDEKPLSEFFAPLDAIERAAGFLIYEKLPKEKLQKINGQKLGARPFRLIN